MAGRLEVSATLAGGAGDEFGGEVESFRGGVWVAVVEAVEEDFDAGAGDFVDGLTDGGELGLAEGGEVDVVKAGDGDVFWDDEFLASAGFDDGGGEEVVGADDGVGLGALEEGFDAVEGVGGGGFAEGEPVFADGEAEALERFAESGATVFHGEVGGIASDEGEIFATFGGEILDHFFDSFLVRDHRLVGFEASGFAADEDDGLSAFLELRKEFGDFGGDFALAAVEENAIDGVRGVAFERGDDAFGLAERAGDHGLESFGG